MEKALESEGVASVGSVISKDGNVSTKPTTVVKLNDKQFKRSLEIQNLPETSRLRCQRFARVDG